MSRFQAHLNSISLDSISNDATLHLEAPFPEFISRMDLATGGTLSRYLAGEKVAQDASR